VADNDEPARNLFFHAEADLGYQQVTEPFGGHRFYYGQGPESHLYANAETLRATLLNNFKAGAGLITFHGHSSWLQWAEEGFMRSYPPPYAGPDDVAALRNGGRLPIVLEMTCFTGFFHRPEVATLDERLLRQPGGGAIAVWGSTGLGLSTGHTALQRGFYRTLNQPGSQILGAAVLAGKLELASTGLHQELLDTFTLFGDPALTMHLTVTPFSNQTYLPLINQ
jgi:hypothetical protein